MPAKTTGQIIWDDIKIFLTSLFMICFLPLGLFLMWSWGIWTPKARKVLTWVGAMAIIIFLLACGDKMKKGRCGGHGWGKGGCGWGQKSDGCGHGGAGWGYGKSPCRGQVSDEGDDDEDEGEEEKEEAPAPAK